MTVEKFRDTMKTHPFRPFTIHMGDGRAFLVKHPEYVLQSPGGRTVIVCDEGEGYSVLDCLLMTELEVHAPTQSEAA